MCFDTNNIRYTTSTQIGEWAHDKMTRYSMLAHEGDPMIWDFGSAAAHHRLYAPWLKPENCRAGLNGLRARSPPTTTSSNEPPARSRSCSERSLVEHATGVDIVEPPMMFALQEEGITVIDGQQIMLDAREIKSPDEIMLLTTACAMVDGAYQLISNTSMLCARTCWTVRVPSSTVPSTSTVAIGSASGFGGSTSCEVAGRHDSPTRGCMTNSASSA